MANPFFGKFFLVNFTISNIMRLSQYSYWACVLKVLPVAYNDYTQQCKYYFLTMALSPFDWDTTTSAEQQYFSNFREGTDRRDFFFYINN